MEDEYVIKRMLEMEDEYVIKTINGCQVKFDKLPAYNCYEFDWTADVLNYMNVAPTDSWRKKSKYWYWELSLTIRRGGGVIEVDATSSKYKSSSSAFRGLDRFVTRLRWKPSKKRKKK